MKLYKFRSLTQDNDLSRVSKILETGEFWHANFSTLNDPIEGGFTIFPREKDVDREMIDRIFTNKNEYKICSFSAEPALYNPTLWGYYANGFKGLVIEIEVEEEKVYPVKYVQDIFHVQDNLDFEIKTIEILTRKFEPWNGECEFRSLQKMKPGVNLHKIGKIKAVYFGSPYESAANKKSIYNENGTLGQYEIEKAKLLEIAKRKKYKCFSVMIEGGKVVPLELN